MADTQTIGKLIVETLFADKGVKKGMSGLQRVIDSGNKSILGFSKMVDQNMVKALKAGAVALAAVSLLTIKVGADFEQSITEVAAVAGATEQEMAKLEDTARSLGATTAFSASQAADGMINLARAGLDAAEVSEATSAALLLAGASSASMNESTAILVSTMAQFKLEATDSTRISDVFSSAMSNSQLSMGSLTEAMKTGGTAAASYGLSLEETVALLAQFRNIGLQGSEAGTALRSSLAALAKPTNEAREALRKYGIEIEDVDPATQDIVDVFRTLGTAGISAADNIAIFGRRVAANVGTVTKGFTESGSEFEKLLGTLESSAGSTEALYDRLMSTVSSRFKILRSGMEEFLLTFFEQFKGPLTELLNAMIGFVGAVTSEVSGRAGEMGNSFEEVIGKVARFIEENTKAGAKAFADFIQSSLDAAESLGPLLASLAQLAVSLAALTPILDELIFLMATVWAAGKVSAFTSAVFAAIPVLTTLTTTVTAFGVALTVSTGGLAALGAALAVIITGLGILIARTISARNETEALAAAQAQQASNLTKAEEGVNQVIARRLATTKTLILDERARLVAEGKLTEEIKIQQDSMLGLNAATATQLFRNGQLIDVNGRLVTVSGALNREGEAGIARVERQIEVTEREIFTTEKLLKTASGPLRAKLLAKLEEQQSKLVSLTQAQIDSRAAAEAGADAVDKEADAFDALTKKMKLTEDELEKLTEDRKAAAETTLEVMQALERDLAGIGADAAARARLALSERIAAIDEAFDSEIALSKANADLVEQINDERNRAIELANVAHRLRQEKAGVEAARDAADKEAAERQKAADLGNRAFEATLPESERLELERQQLLTDAVFAGESERLAVIADFDARITAAKEQEAEARVDGEKKWLDRVLSDVGDWATKTISVVQNVASTITDIFDAATGAISKLFDSLTGGIEFNLTAIVTDLIQQMEAAQEAALEEGGRTGPNDPGLATIEETAETFVSDMVDGAVEFVQAMIAATPAILQSFIDELPKLIDAFIESIPEVFGAIAEAVPGIIDLIVDAIPRITEALIEGIPDLLQSILEGIPLIIEAATEGLVQIIAFLPELIDMILASLPDIIDAVVDSVPLIINAVVEAIPLIFDAIIENLPGIIESLIASIPVIIFAVLDAIPKLINSVLEAIPQIVKVLLDSIPFLIETIIGMLPDLIIALALLIPDILPALIALIPDLIHAILDALPEIVIALVEALVVEIILKLPEIIFELMKGLLESVVEIGKAIGESILSIIPGIGKDKDKTNKKGGKGLDSDDSGFFKDIGEAFGSIFGLQSGIENVPKTLLARLEPGEAVLDAETNARRMAGRSLPNMPAPAPVAGGGGGGGADTLEVIVVAESRVLDAVQATGLQRGHMPKLARSNRKASGVQVGFSRGRLNLWNG